MRERNLRTVEAVAWIWPQDSDVAYGARLPDGPIVVLPEGVALVWEEIREKGVEELVARVMELSGLTVESAEVYVGSAIDQLHHHGLLALGD